MGGIKIRYPIVPDDESSFSTGSIKKDLEGFLHNDKIYIEYDPKNKYFLFQLGMILAYNHYTDAARMPRKDYRLITPIEQTSHKSYGNVIHHFIKNGTAQLPRYSRDDKKAFIISSVRNSDVNDVERGRLEKKKLADEGIIGHFPYDDTPQDDLIGKDIVKYNLEKEAESGIEALIYKPDSTGSVVDLGSFYILKHVLDGAMNYYYVPHGRRLMLLNDLGDSPFENFIRELSKNK